MNIDFFRFRFVASAGFALAAFVLLRAQGPDHAPRHEGSILAAAAVDAGFFGRQLQMTEERRASWLQQAEAATPPLFRTVKTPVAVITVERHEPSFQGWRIASKKPVETACNRPLVSGEEFILDFGEHLTGRLELDLQHFGIPVDAPVRLKLVFGEVLAEIAEPFDSYAGTLARSWLQDEYVNIDVVPQALKMPRRYAFRYVKVTVVSAGTHGKSGFKGIRAEAVTSADESRVAPFTPRSAEDEALDRISRNTLRDCMQTVFEDGPKRDRRLWLGDLRLQALANYATYRNYDLVKRSLYLLAGTATKEGLVSTCAFEQPKAARGDNSILDYTALFAPTVLEYLQASGDRRTAEDLWPLVLKQLDFTLEFVNSEGLFVSPRGWWLFVDWNRTLDKQASEHAIILFGLKATRRLATELGKGGEAVFLDEIISRMESAGRRHLWDESLGMFISGPKRELSWAAQAWMVLAGVPTAEQGKRAMLAVMANPSAEKPVTPYLHHYVIEALLSVGLQSEADALLHNYWGAMIKKGADTFWEVYLPEDEHASPYKSHLMNSYCHAWSCTPTYLLRKMSPTP